MIWSLIFMHRLTKGCQLQLLPVFPVFSVSQSHIIDPGSVLRKSSLIGKDQSKQSVREAAETFYG